MRALLGPLVCAALVATAPGEQIAGARMTRVIKDVKILQGQTARAAVVNDQIPTSAVVRTAAGSRAEFVSTGQMVTRLASKTFLSMSGDAGYLALNQGAVLVQAPRASRTARIRAGAATIDFGGATGIIERFGGTYVKILVLQGKARVFLPARVGESVLVTAGQLLIAKPGATSLPEPVDFDIAHLYETSLLTNADFRPLPSQPRIEQAIQEQRNNPDLNATNLVILGRGTMVHLVEPTPSQTQAPSNGPRASPSRTR